MLSQCEAGDRCIRRNGETLTYVRKAGNASLRQPSPWPRHVLTNGEIYYTYEEDGRWQSDSPESSPMTIVRVIRAERLA